MHAPRFAIGLCFSSLAILGSVIACSSDEGGTRSRVNATGATGAGADSNGGSGPLGGQTGNSGGGLNLGGGEGGSSGACQEDKQDFTPKTPSVLLLVDRSGSMFEGNLWDPLKAALIGPTGTADKPVVEALQDQVRFGFTSFTGANSTCPLELSPEVPFALGNFEAIRTNYAGLKKLDNGETPVAAAFRKARELLAKEPANADKYILLATDGDPDFCDNGDVVCRSDAAVYEIELTAKAGIKTLVLGLKYGDKTKDEVLQAYANAGAGLPATLLAAAPQTLNVFNNCNSVNQWKTWDPAVTLDQNGRKTLATYKEGMNCATETCAPFFTPDATSTAKLREQLQSVLSGVRSCKFALDAKIEVDRTKLGDATIVIQGKTLPLVPDLKDTTTAGWKMNEANEIEIQGQYCTDWLAPSATGDYSTSFGFPCNVITIIK